MVLKPGIILTILLFLVICFLSACEKLYIVDCSECELTEPSTCNLKIKLGESISGSPYDVTIYRGTIQDGVVIYNTSINTSFYHRVSLNSEYTVTATIVFNGKEYTAVDSTRPKVDVITDACDETCYYVVNRTINLKIKYY